MAASQGDHANIPSGTLIHQRYLVDKEIGCGNFSRVFRCRDTKASSPSQAVLALKVVKKEYANDAAFERDMLKILAAKDTSNSANVSKMSDQFTWNRHPCFVMPMRGPSLRSRKLGVTRGHISRDNLLRLTKSLLESLKFVHFECKMVHTDLKPENILLGEMSDQAQSDSTYLGDTWALCDFGSASLWRADRMDSDLISTRPYRAPEVVLGNPWSYPADMWSLGCILYECAAGSRLFEVHDDNTHLHFMNARLGPLPEMFTKRSKHSRKFFNGVTGDMIRPLSSSAAGAGRAAAAAAAAAHPSAASRSGAPRPLAEVFEGDALLIDLLQSMLHYDPTKRIRADDALSHPIFTITTQQQKETAKKETLTSSSSPSRKHADATAGIDGHDAPSTTTTTTASAAAAGAAVVSRKPSSAELKRLQLKLASAQNQLHVDVASSGQTSNASNYKFRALPPLLNALNAVGGIPSDENAAVPQSSRMKSTAKLQQPNLHAAVSKTSAGGITKPWGGLSAKPSAALNQAHPATTTLAAAGKPSSGRNFAR